MGRVAWILERSMGVRASRWDLGSLLKKVHDRFGGNTAILSAIEELKRDTKAGFGRVETRLDKVETRLNNVETDVHGMKQEMKKELAAINTKLTAHDTKFKDLDTKVSKMDTKVSRAETMIGHCLENQLRSSVRWLYGGVYGQSFVAKSLHELVSLVPDKLHLGTGWEGLDRTLFVAEKLVDEQVAEKFRKNTLALRGTKCFPEALKETLDKFLGLPTKREKVESLIRGDGLGLLLSLYASTPTAVLKDTSIRSYSQGLEFDVRGTMTHADGKVVISTGEVKVRVKGKAIRQLGIRLNVLEYIVLKCFEGSNTGGEVQKRSVDVIKVGKLFVPRTWTVEGVDEDEGSEADDGGGAENKPRRWQWASKQRKEALEQFGFDLQVEELQV